MSFPLGQSPVVSSLTESSLQEIGGVRSDNTKKKSFKNGLTNTGGIELGRHAPQTLLSSILAIYNA